MYIGVTVVSIGIVERVNRVEVDKDEDEISLRSPGPRHLSISECR